MGHKRESTTDIYLGSLVPGLDEVSGAIEDADENKAANQAANEDSENEEN
ncbi:hypothetical protein [Desulfatibacillum alkenivorans]|nr:hypothetical protein [Desulfatibacillum alkenivorans]